MNRRGPTSRGASGLVATAALALALAMSSALPAAATGAVTVGSDLTPDPSQAPSGAGTGPRTIANVALPGSQVASPIDGVLVRWRVRAAMTDLAGNEVALKVIRPAPAGSYTSVNTSARRTVTTPSPATFTFATAQPIRAGDLIGLDIGDANGNFAVQTTIQSGLHVLRWQPNPLLDGQTRPPDNDPFGFDYGEHAFNADVEPDLDCDGLGDETQDPSVVPGCVPQPDDDLLDLSAAKHNTLGRLAVNASCFESCQLTLKGAVRVRGQRFKLRTRRMELGGNEIRRVRVRVKRAGQRARLKRLIANRKRAVARISGVARADAKVDRERLKVRLRRPRRG